jgi:hypothetical protein
MAMKRDTITQNTNGSNTAAIYHAIRAENDKISENSAREIRPRGSIVGIPSEALPLTKNQTLRPSRGMFVSILCDKQEISLWTKEINAQFPGELDPALPYSPYSTNAYRIWPHHFPSSHRLDNFVSLT